MGVNDLHSYLSSKKQVLKKHSFRDSKLIIDGPNLYHTLYFNSSLDQEHGGEYDAFEKEVSRFFRNLKECSILPYVVLDGGDDVGEEKFDALKKRAESRIKKANALSMGRPRNVLPILVKSVFLQLLGKLDVPLVQCVTKAGWEAAALANEWNCPVLSNNTDFYIFDLKAGFMPLRRFQWRNLVSAKQSDKKFIPAKLFTVNHLCVKVKCVKKNILPIFATVLANDYAHLDKRMLLSWSQNSGSDEEARHVDGLLRWLSYFPGPAEAIGAIMGSTTNPDGSAMLIKALTECLQEYRLTPSPIAQFFTSGDPQGRLPGPLQHLPEWTLKPLAKGKLNSIVVDVLASQRVILNCPVQNCWRCSANLASRPIRQIVYGLLLCTRPRNARGQGSPEPEVEEYDRQGLTLTSSRVAAVLPSQAIPNLHLERLWETPWHLRVQVFLDTLCASQAPVQLPVLPSLQLAVYVTCYWLKHAQPEPRPEFYWALLIGLVYGELARDPRMEKRKGTVPTRLKNLKSRTEKMEKVPLDLEAAHAYSQWQCTLRDSICLNQLLGNPVPEPEYAWLYSGALVHGSAVELKKGSPPESLLSGAPHALQLYQQLKEAVEHELDEDAGARVGAGTEGPSPRPAGGKRTDDLSNTFKHLTTNGAVSDEGPRGRSRKSEASDHDDVIYEETCAVRARHKSRSRKADPKSKKYERSRWE